MFKKLLTFGMLIVVVIGTGIGIYFAVFCKDESYSEKSKTQEIFGLVQTKQVQITEFFTYGKAFNLSGTIDNVSKDNFESVKLYLTDANGFEKTYKLNGKFEEGKLIVTTTDEINSGLILDDLEPGNYVLLVRLKLNNSVNPKYYSLSNISNYENIEYYTVTKNDKNNKIEIKFDTKKYKENNYDYMKIDVSENIENLDIYDIVIDAGHGGKDVGEKLGSDTEANITLSYAKLLKQKLEEKGFKVKLSRDDSNTETFTTTNMYDENGRITIACKSKAKYMFSLHLNNGNNGLRGVEIYSPCKSDLSLAQKMANKIIENTDIEYSNNNSFKKGEGVYVRNFTQSIINEYTNTANKKGYEPYNITLDTPFLYTIREVGGIATNAYVDGRNKSYSANKYYRSNQGIECYQIELGYIKNDLEIIKSQMEEYTTAISEAISEEI